MSDPLQPSSSVSSRRRFLAAMSGLGLGGTLLPGVLWATMEQGGVQKISLPMLQAAAAVSGCEPGDQRGSR